MTSFTDLKVGVLALQGAVSEHLAQLKVLGVQGVAVKHPEQLDELQGLILPGGESTTISKLMHRYGFMKAVKTFAHEGKGIFGTCAGMILLAKQIEHQTEAHLALMDIEVSRNAYGRQVDSFDVPVTIKTANGPVEVPAVFIRAPAVKKLLSDQVEVLASQNEIPVLVREGKLLACSFHPELTEDTHIMALFANMLVC